MYLTLVRPHCSSTLGFLSIDCLSMLGEDQLHVLRLVINMKLSLVTTY